MKEDKVSVIIPTHNRPKLLKECLLSVFKNETCEIIVISDHPNKKTEELMNILLEKNTNLIFIKNKNNGAASSRNLGLKKSSGDIIVFLDDDCSVPKNWIKNIKKEHKKFNHEIIFGDVKPKNYKLIPYFSYIIEQPRKYPTLIANSSYKKIVTKKMLFNENIKIGEDLDFNYRCIAKGFNYIYSQNFEIYHEYRTNLKDFLIQQFNYGVSRYFIFSKLNDYPYHSENNYFLKRLKRFVFLPFINTKMAFLDKRKDFILILFLSILQQTVYSCGYIFGYTGLKK
jgi:glycosyltransferase involved in cell wall biosynthesis